MTIEIISLSISTKACDWAMIELMTTGSAVAKDCAMLPSFYLFVCIKLSFFKIGAKGWSMIVAFQGLFHVFLDCCCTRCLIVLTKGHV